MRLKPDAHNLLTTALAAFRADILPHVPKEKRYAALMIANALAMVERELAAPAGAPPPGVAALYGPGDWLSDNFEQRLAADIEAGLFDAPGPRRHAAFEAVKAVNAARLAVTNPKRQRATDSAELGSALPQSSSARDV
jgi:hypothetical protein